MDAAIPAPTAPHPVPVRPDFDGSCLVNLVPSLLAGLPPGAGGARGAGGAMAAARTAGVGAGGGAGAAGAAGGVSPAAPGKRAPVRLRLPEVDGASQVVLLVLDGLGARQLEDRRAQAPVLASGGSRRLTSVAPSTTAAALTSLTTGVPPAVHGMVGYRVVVGGRVLNVLKWTIDGGDARQRVRPPAFRRAAPFGRPTPRRVPVVSRAEYAATGFTAAHLGDAALHGWHTAAGVVVEVRRLVEAGEPFVYAYYDGLDRTSHAHGLGEHYAGELRTCDRLVGDLLEALPANAALVVTADHGQVEVGPRLEVPNGELMEGVVLCSGEGRFRWFHTAPGAAEDVAAIARAQYGAIAWVWTRAQLIEEGWLGGEPVPEVADRLGDVVVAPFAPTAVLDPADTGEQRLVGRHGSLTEDEMLVPLLAWRPTG